MPFRIQPDGFRPVWCYLVGFVRENPVHRGRVFLFDRVCYCLLSAQLLHNLKKRYPSPNNLKADVTKRPAIGQQRPSQRADFWWMGKILGLTRVTPFIVALW